MYTSTRKCVVCGKTVRWQKYLCADCEARYPEPHPEWLRFLVNDQARERMALHRQRVIEVPFFDDQHKPGVQCNQGLPSQSRDPAPVYDELDAMGLGADNADYWESLPYD